MSLLDAVSGLSTWSTRTFIDWMMDNPRDALSYWTGHGDGWAIQKRMYGYMREKALSDPEFLARVGVVVVEQARDRMGIELDPNAPFSSASLTSAISGKIGIPLTNIMDKDALKSDVLRYSASAAAAQTGLTLDPADPFSKRSITAAVSVAAGIPLTDITDKAQVRADVLSYAQGLVMDDLKNRVDSGIARAAKAQTVSQVSALYELAKDAKEIDKLPGPQVTMAAVRGALIDVHKQVVAEGQAKLCMWNKELARKGAQVMASRRYRERMKQDGWSKSWTRNGVIAD